MTAHAEDLALGREVARAIREAREGAGLSQLALSARIGVSRGTVEHIERLSGKVDVGFMKVAAAAREAGLRLGLYRENPAILERKLERERAAVRAAKARERHFRIALQLATRDPGAVSKLREARRMVALWKEARSCSPEYIDGWSRIVNEEPLLAAKRLLEVDPAWLDAMFQNTPFALGTEPGRK